MKIKVGKQHFLVLLFGLMPISLLGQPQLVLLKGETVIRRYYAGDQLSFQVKGTPIRVSGYLNNILKDALVIREDTFKLYEIEKTFAPERRVAKSIGSKLVAAGLLLFIADQFNWVVIQKNEAELDTGVTIISLAGILAGLPMVLIHKEGQELGYKYRLLSIDEDSPFYREAVFQISPYLVE